MSGLGTLRVEKEIPKLSSQHCLTHFNHSFFFVVETYRQAVMEIIYYVNIRFDALGSQHAIVCIRIRTFLRSRIRSRKVVSVCEVFSFLTTSITRSFHIFMLWQSGWQITTFCHKICIFGFQYYFFKIISDGQISL